MKRLKEALDESIEFVRDPRRREEIIKLGRKRTIFDVRLFHLNAEFIRRKKMCILRGLAIVGLMNILTITFFAESLPWSVFPIPFFSTAIALVSFAALHAYFMGLLRSIDRPIDIYHVRVAIYNCSIVIAWFVIAFPVLSSIADLLSPQYWILSELRIPWIGVYLLTLFGYLGSFGSIKENVDMAGQYWKEMEASAKSYLRYVEDSSRLSDLEHALDHIEQARSLTTRLRYRMSSFSRTSYMLVLIRRKALHEGIDLREYLRKALVHVYNPIERMKQVLNMPRNLALMIRIVIGIGDR